jgi:hypothetical protein
MRINRRHPRHLRSSFPRVRARATFRNRRQARRLPVQVTSPIQAPLFATVGTRAFAPLLPSVVLNLSRALALRLYVARIDGWKSRSPDHPGIKQPGSGSTC